jgi:serpin B
MPPATRLRRSARPLLIALIPLVAGCARPEAPLEPPFTSSPPADGPGPAAALAAPPAAPAAAPWGPALLRAAAPAGGNALIGVGSVGPALGLAAVGARGSSRAQLEALLGPDLGAAPVPDGVLRASRVWVLEGYDVRNEALREARFRFGADAAPQPFAADPEGSRSGINAWVGEQTRGLIPDLLPRGSVTSLTRLVLTDALYLKAAWATPFSPELTRPGPFTAPGQAPVEVPMMRRQGTLAHAKAGGVTAVALPFAGGALELVVMLPDDPTALDATFDALPALDAAWQRAPVQLQLPRFRLQQAVELTPALKALGVTAPFGPEADLSGFAGEPGQLQITGVHHQAVVEVDEAGAEAAAATGVVVALRSAAPAPFVLPFIVDRPFTFALRGAGGGAPLFLGRVASL